jgi:hypothetical protein
MFFIGAAIRNQMEENGKERRKGKKVLNAEDAEKGSRGRGELQQTADDD